MTEFYNVAAQVQFTAEPSSILIDNRSGLGLRIDWRVTKTNTSESDFAEIAVFNMARASRQILAAALPPFVDRVRTTLSIGWNGVPEVVFMGDAWKIDPEIREVPNVITAVEAGDGLPPVRDTPPSGGVEVGIAIQLAVAKVLGKMGLPPSADALAKVSAAAAGLPLKTFQLTFDDDPREILDALLATLGLTWGISDGLFVVFSSGLRNDVAPIVLSAIGGLLKASLTNDGGVAFVALANPRAVPGGQVTVVTVKDGAMGGGPLRIERVEFTGSTRGRSIMTGIARKVLVA